MYSTNVLMRACDLLATKPSELAYYPVPKLMLKHIGGHEVWGAIRAHELGDGTAELESTPDVLREIDHIQADRDVVSRMCDAIERNDAAGVYNGAYRVVNLAVNGTAAL